MNILGIYKLNDVMSEKLNNISQQVKLLRKKNGWSQQMLAELSGLDRTTIGALERNNYSDIGIRKVQRVLQVLGRSLVLVELGLPSLDELQSIKSSADYPAGRGG